MYVLENASLQLKRRRPVPANSSITDLTEQQMGDNIYARNSFLSFWRQFIHSQTGQICFVMHQSIIQWKWVSDFQGNSPISLPTALTGAPGEITIKQTSVYFLSVSTSTASEVGADMKDLPALPEPKFWGNWD